MEESKTLLNSSSNSRTLEALLEQGFASTNELAEDLGLKPKTLDNYCSAGYVEAEKIDATWYIHPNSIRFINMFHKLNLSNISDYIRTYCHNLRELDDKVQFINEAIMTSRKGTRKSREFIDKEIADRLKSFYELKKISNIDNIPRGWLTHLYDFQDNFESFLNSIDIPKEEIKIKPKPVDNIKPYDKARTIKDYPVGERIKHETFGVCKVLPRFNETFEIRKMLEKYGKFSPFIKTKENIENDKYNPMIRVETSEGREFLLRVSKE